MTTLAMGRSDENRRGDENGSKPAGMTVGGHIVKCDERQRWKWKTHYRDSYTPRAYVSIVANEDTRDVRIMHSACGLGMS